MAMMAQALGRTKRVQRESKRAKESQKEFKGSSKGVQREFKGSQRESKRESMGVKGRQRDPFVGMMAQALGRTKRVERGQKILPFERGQKNTAF